MKKLILAATLLCAWSAVPAVAAEPVMVGDAAAGQQKSAVCAACHGADGKALQPNYPKPRRSAPLLHRQAADQLP